MYLDIRIYLKSLPFLLSVRKQPPGRHCANECSWEFCGIRGGAPVLGLFFNKVAGLQPVVLLRGRLLHGCLILWVLPDFWERPFYKASSWMAASVCFICDIFQIYKLRKNILLDVILCITCIQFCVSYVLFQNWSCKFD